jgi:hypothetical protein
MASSVAAGASAAGSSVAAGASAAGCSGAGVGALPPQAATIKVSTTNRLISQNKRLLISFLLEFISTQKFAKKILLAGIFQTVRIESVTPLQSRWYMPLSTLARLIEVTWRSFSGLDSAGDGNMEA